MSKYKPDIILIIHLLLGLFSAYFPAFIYYWVFLVFGLGVYLTITRSRTYAPYEIAAYLVGLELLGRMSASGLPHEFTKYAVSLILVIPILREQKVIHQAFVFFFLLLIPGVLLTDGGSLEQTRQLISANLSGPFCLAISVIYFYNRPINLIALRKIFLTVLFPLAAILGYLIIKTPDFSEIEFGFKSNFATSVYGPNQMSSMLGLGLLIIGLSYFLKIRLFGSYLLSLALFGMLLFRGLLTFSRGGMLTVAILLVMVFIYLSWKLGGLNKNMWRILLVAVAVGIGTKFAFDFTNQLTGNALYNRYAGVKNGKQIEDVDKLTSGRTKITYIDWQIFQDNPVVGVGVGMGKFVRVKYGLHVEAAAHNEFSRILAEHGILGIGALLILLIVPIKRFFNSNNIVERILIISFIGFCFVFMTHAATRLAAPCFLYGLAFVHIIRFSAVTNDSIFRKQTQPMGRIPVGN